MKKFTILLVVIFLLVGTITSFALAKKEITVGAKNFTEQYVLGNMISILLENNGFEVTEKFGTGSAITREGLTSGQTDLYAEYTGTASLVYLKHEEVITDPVKLYNKVKKEDLEKNGIVWLDRSGINNTYAIALTKEQVAEIGTTLSDLAKYVNEHHDLIWGIDHEFAERADGLPGLAEHYGMNINKENIKTMDPGLTYEALDRGQTDITMVFATDGKIKKYGLQVLKDDQQFFPVYNICVNVREEVLNKYPEIREILKPISELDDETMTELDYQVDATGLPAKLVAKNFLREKGYIE
ncbi:MAG: glycine/betaine ABC transporter substrate-binding protein [Candidatus Nealsonbacteria bacterium]|nr:MAG: glycine/betaine ABC transporter substrate-binding protein [Candidatus Nealsonbacteria bacterium]